jgi:hypothetical protein
MILPLAHAGHVLVDILIYGSPVVLGVIALKYADRKARQEDEEQDAASS